MKILSTVTKALAALFTNTPYFHKEVKLPIVHGKNPRKKYANKKISFQHNVRPTGSNRKKAIGLYTSAKKIAA